MKKVLFILFCLQILCTTSVFAQYYEKEEKGVSRQDSRPSVTDRMFFGGNFGLSFGNNITFVNISPTVGYMITPNFSAGVGIIYQYTKYNNIGFGTRDFSAHDYGARLFSRYYIFRPFFIQAEYEYLNFEYATDYANNEWVTTRDSFNSFLAGGGISQPIGNKAFFNATILYNFSYDDNDLNSPYNSPVVYRIGIGASF